MPLSELFSRVVNMSLTASGVILVVLLARLVLRRAPKVFSYALWAAVLFRLLCPVSIPSPVSLLKLVDPPVSQASPVVSRVEYIAPERVEAPVLPAVPEAEDVHTAPAASSAPVKKAVTLRDMLPYLWLTGAAGMLLYGLISFLRFRKHLTGALPVGGNLYLVDHLDSAFVTGLVFPKIYLPSDLPAGRMEYIVAHERHHIRRLDYIAKHLSFLALCVHWFNPLVWVAFLLSGRDMEMSCDEAVIRKLGSSIRANYSESLIDLATRRVTVAGSPLAFGEGDTKRRIINLLHWKEPRKIVTLLCTVAAVIIFTACAANPEKPAVVSKNDGSFDRNSAVSAEETHAPDATQAAIYTDTFTSTDGTVEYRIALDETVTGADMPVVKVAPHFLTEDDAKRVAEAVFGADTVFYEAEPALNQRFSQEEITQQIARWSQYTTAEALGEILTYGDLEDAAETIQNYLPWLSTEVYPNAPVGDFRQKCQWRFHKDAYYTYGPEDAASMDTSEDNDQISAWIRDGDFFFSLKVSTRNKSDFKINNIFMEPVYAGPLMLDYEIMRARYLRTDPPSREQIAFAKAKAQEILDRIDLGTWKVNSARVEAFEEGGAKEYSIEVNAVPVFCGAPALYRGQLSNLKSKDATASNYYLTDANFTFSAEGKLIGFELWSPVDVTEIVNDNVQTISVEDLIARAKEQLTLTDASRYSDAWLTDNFSLKELLCTVTIEALEYGLVRTKVPNTDEAYYYVPALTFSGSYQFTGRENGELYSQSSNIYGGNSVTLLTLNAIDGTVISTFNS